MNSRTIGTDPKEHYTGKLSFYIFKKKSRNPLFLQRNIRRVLDTHQKVLKARRAKKQQRMKNPGSASNGHIVTTLGSEKNWSPKEIINILESKTFSSRDPVLRIDVTAIRDRFAKFRDAKDIDEPPKKQAKVSPVEATCSLTIWDSTSGTFDTVVEQTRKCEVVQQNKPSGERYASVELSEPFIVTLQKLLPKRERASQTYGEQLFSMQLAIMAANSTDQWPPVETKLPTPRTAQFRDPTGHLVRFPVLVAKWLRLPRVPENQAESLLELFASQDQGKYKPKLSLKIDAQWMEAPSPLTVYNSAYRNGLASPESSSRSSSTQNRNRGRKMAKTSWIFEGLVDFMDKLSFDGHTCALCHGQHFQDASELHFHLINGHDIFKFDYNQKFEIDSAGHQIAQGLVRVEIAEGYERKQVGRKVPDFREMTWIRPDRPFDLEAFLKGDESWLGKPSRRSNLSVPAPHLERSTSREVNKDVPLSAITRPPDQVPNLVSPVRKKFRVPPAPNGVRFYRTTAKCPLNEGDEVSESDDDIDEEWLLEKHTDTINSFTDTLPQEKEFMQKYDQHMLQEDISSDLHAGEALIRFCRSNKPWLQRPSMRLEFSKKAAALKLQGALSSTVIRACLAIINSPAPIKTKSGNMMELDSPPQLSSKNSRLANKLAPNGGTGRQSKSYRPLTPPEIGHIYGRCVKCNEAILDMRDNIRCENPLCEHANHHLNCVGLGQREESWVCDECKRSGFVPEPRIRATRSLATSTNVTTSAATPPAAAFAAPVSPPRSASASAPDFSAATLTKSAGGGGNALAIRSRESSPTWGANINRDKQPSLSTDDNARLESQTRGGSAATDHKANTDGPAQQSSLKPTGKGINDKDEGAGAANTESGKKSTAHITISSNEDDSDDGHDEFLSNSQESSDEEYRESKAGEVEEDGDLIMEG
ncbi:hypothetical protein MMC10_000093 [Thelotrema lepadinum]|nr:hypothetical protein [Thelotrema lepadinum]